MLSCRACMLILLNDSNLDSFTSPAISYSIETLLRTGSTTMRNTNVVVIPNCAELSEFKTFDALVQAINMARRRARDFVVKKDEQEDEMSKWV